MSYIAFIAASLTVLSAAQATSQSPSPEDMVFLQKECKAGKAAACRTLGDVYLDRTGPDDAALAAGYYKQACDGKDAAGCVRFGLAHVMGRGVAKDPARAFALVKQTCDAGFAEGCTALGALYDRGIGVEKNQAVASLLWETACAKGDPEACYRRALALRNVERQYEKADGFLRRSCEGGFQSACEMYLPWVMGEWKPGSGLKEVCARHILIKVTSPPRKSKGKAESEAEAKDLAESILFSLNVMKNDFAELARKVSEDESTAKDGGNLGCFARGTMVDSFEKAAFALKVGETSAVVKSDFGFHIIQRLAKPEK